MANEEHVHKDNSEKAISEEPREIAVADLGSNSFHLIVARVVNDVPQIISRIKQRVHLADGLDENDLLSVEAFERGLNCLNLFAERLHGFPTDNVRIIATQALRQATNADVFLQKASHILPYPIEIISGQEEARLIYMGLAHTHTEQGQRLIIDIGGGSTELTIGESFTPLIARSREMGCVVYTKRFFPDRKISRQQFRRAQLAAELQLDSLAYKFRAKGWDHVFGSSGSIKTLNGMLNTVMGITDNIITSKRIASAVEYILQFSSFDELEAIGISSERKDIFIAGLAILSGLFSALKIQELRIANGALREGVLYEMDNARFRHHNIRSRTAKNLAEHYNIDHHQAERVLTTTKILYQQWGQQNSDLVDPQLGALLNWSAQLHEVGLNINYHNLQKHSAYILQHSDLPGFNQEQQLILSTLVRFHRKNIQPKDIPSFNLFKKEQILSLIQLLRLAILLNNQRQATMPIEQLTLISQGFHIALIFPSDYLSLNNLLCADIENEQHYWKQMEGWELTITEQKL